MSKRKKKKKNRLKEKPPKWGKNLESENRAEEACHEYTTIVSTSGQGSISKTIHILCSKWRIRQGDFRSYFNKLFQCSPEEYYISIWNKEGADLSHAFVPKSVNMPNVKDRKNKKRNKRNNGGNVQDEAWNRLLAMVEMAKRIAMSSQVSTNT
jgi:hypothetical protein